MSSPTRKVVDKNMLDRKNFPAVQRYLQASPNNELVICDYLVMECMKGDPVRNFCSDFSQLVPYASQLVATKPVWAIEALDPHPKGLQNRLICAEQTKMLRRLPVWLKEIQRYGPGESFTSFAAKCDVFFAKLIRDVPEMRKHFSQVIATWPAEEIQKIRKREPTSRQFHEILIENISSNAALMYAGVPLKDVPRFRNVIYALQFRFALCATLLALDRSISGLANAKDDQLSNDVVDMMYASYATFFDGFFSMDARASRIYSQAKPILAAYIQSNSEG